MENREFKLDSGATLLVTPAPFADANALKNAILRALKGAGLGDLELPKLKAAWEAGNRDASALIGVVADCALSVASSPDVENALFKCAERAVYSPDGSDGARVKVSRALFDDEKHAEQARGDYYVIARHLIEVNVGPFFKAVFSALSARPRKEAAAQASR